jgi:hypothetical protein
VFGEPVGPLPDLKADKLPERQLTALEGDYQFGPDYYVPNALMTVRRRDGHLEAAIGDYMMPLVPISASRFLLRSFWIPADFAIGKDGNATGLEIDGRKGVRLRSKPGS